MCLVSYEPHGEDVTQGDRDQCRMLGDQELEALSEIEIGMLGAHLWNYTFFSQARW